MLPEDVVEDVGHLRGQRLKMARELGRARGCGRRADDPGLEVAALNNAPACSRPVSGRALQLSANNAKLLRELSARHRPPARFRCVIALCAPDGREWTVEGRCPGRIIGETRGSNGFGYDPLFVPDGHERTFAELDGATKNSLSHRGHALRRAAAEWRALLVAG
jgi:XTP/dITP diphosphohydrolase